MLASGNSVPIPVELPKNRVVASYVILVEPDEPEETFVELMETFTVSPSTEKVLPTPRKLIVLTGSGVTKTPLELTLIPAVPVVDTSANTNDLVG